MWGGLFVRFDDVTGKLKISLEKETDFLADCPYFSHAVIQRNGIFNLYDEYPVVMSKISFFFEYIKKTGTRRIK